MKTWSKPTAGNTGTPSVPATLNDLTDVAISSPQANQVVSYDGSTFINSEVPGLADIQAQFNTLNASNLTSGIIDYARLPNLAGIVLGGDAVAPFISSISPAITGSAGTQNVIITGEYFTPITQLSFIGASGISISNYQVVSPNKITCTLNKINNISGVLTITARNANNTNQLWTEGIKNINLGDPHLNNVVLFVKADGVNGSTNIIDSSLNPKTINKFGNIKISTDQSKYGGSSLFCDGAGDYLSINSDQAFSAGAGDFCYEAWIKTSSTKAYMCLFQRNPYVSTNGFVLLLNGGSGDGKPEIYWYSWANSLFFKSSGSSILDNQWHHIAFTRSGTTCRMFIDGLQVAEKSNVSTLVPAGSLVIGNDVDFAGRDFDGYIDSIRITIGQARYTSNFNPETDTYLNI